ncbi:hypothetical protein [Spirosoma radiotolerans]|uniref:Membrane protein n=1 Tax=Spirosoma radiotolerans TaxID=1379870 RepID=A0A0E3ZXZ4_9BACT|nr:hypothetical protein [Spirosoma radiotolerans]AKD56718.1 membrane protein [Spirosoma radiotolerans]
MQPNLVYLFTKPPLWLAVFFALTTALTLFSFLMAVRQSMPKRTLPLLAGLLIWLLLLGLLASQDLFLNLNAKPPRLPLAVVLPLLLIILLFVSRGGRRFLDALSLPAITYLNTVRVLVEITLYGLFIHHQVPELITFEGRNFDIIAGLTAPIIAYFSFNRPVLSTRWLFLWNVLALLLLTNVVTHAILSTPLPFQQFAFEQPNVAILKFPYIWLPGFVVPTVLLGHLVAIRRLLISQP